MNNQPYLKPNRLSSCFVSVFLTLDGFFVLSLGLFYLYLSWIGDPAPGDTSKGTTVFYAQVIAWLTFTYFIACFVSLILWIIGKSNWKYVILALGIFPFIGSVVLLIISRGWGSDWNFVRYPFFVSLGINALLFAFIVSDIKKSKYSIQHHNA